MPIDDVELRAPSGAGPDQEYEREQRKKVLDGYLAQLEEVHRVVLELRYMGEKSYAEISEIMDIPMGTVKTHIHRAKVELKKAMTKRTVDGQLRSLQGP